MMKKILLFLFTLKTIAVYSQELENLVVKLPSQNILTDSVFIIINEQYNVIFSYSLNNITKRRTIFQKSNYTINELIKKIAKENDLTYRIEGKKIILYSLKKKKLQLSGYIYDIGTGDKIPDVNVIVKGQNTGSVSMPNGYYSIKLEPGSYNLIFSFVGYETCEKFIEIQNDTNVIVSLKASTQEVDEVKVTSSLRKFYDLDIGRPMESINARQIEKSQINNASGLLQGRFSGVWATQTSGMPGDHQRIRIRGINSLFGSVDPLYVIDGVSVPVVNLNSLGVADLNTYDIENITVLKDISSTALFGFQGGNGVVLIETKRGKKENNLTFSTRQGIQWFPKRYDLMGTKDFLENLDSVNKFFGIDIRRYYPMYDTAIEKFRYDESLASTNWQDNLFKIGRINEYQLAGSGTFLGTNFYVSGSYLKNTGIISRSGYNRYTLSANVEHTFFNKIELEAGYRGSYQKNSNNLDSYEGNRIIFEGINKSPCLLTTPDSLYYDEDPMMHTKYIAYRVFNKYVKLNSGEHPDSLIKYTNKTSDIASNTFRLALISRFGNFSARIASDLSLRDFHYFSHLDDPYSLEASYAEGNYQLPSWYIDSYEHVIVFNSQCNLDYHKIIQKHDIKVMSGLKYYIDNVYWKDSVPSSVNYMGSESSQTSVNNEAYIRNSMAIHGPKGAVIREIISSMFNFSYSFDQKYSISIAGNIESLNEGKYVDDIRLFPSIAVNWDIAREFKRLQFLNHFNVFSGWGKSGNYPLNGLSNDLYSNTVHVSTGSKTYEGNYLHTLSNHNLKEETVEEYNIGSNLDLFKNSRLKLEGNWYKRINSDLIILRETPLYYGGGKIFYNIGQLENNGREYTIEAIPALSRDFSLYFKINYTAFSQKVKKLNNIINIVSTSDILVPSFIIDKESNLGDFYGYKYLAKKARKERVAINEIAINNVKYLNPDSNNLLDEKDKITIGNSIPKFNLNFYTSISYKLFSLDMLWYGIFKVDKYNATRAGTYIASTNKELKNIVGDTLNIFTGSYFYQSSYFAEDASFIRLKQLTFSFEPKGKIKNIISYKISLTFENLITLTKYKGYDPEASIYTDNNFSDNAIDRGSYPNPKSVFLSITLKL